MANRNSDKDVDGERAQVAVQLSRLQEQTPGLNSSSSQQILLLPQIVFSNPYLAANCQQFIAAIKQQGTANCQQIQSAILNQINIPSNLSKDLSTILLLSTWEYTLQVNFAAKALSNNK